MFDGIFTKHIVNELKKIENLRINKVNSINDTDFFFLLSNKEKLFISINSNTMHIRLTKMDLVNSFSKNNFYQVLKKYLESSIINNITQHNNDRIIKINVNHYDELGYTSNIDLIIEFFGRNSNIVLVNDKGEIIDCYKRLFDESLQDRLMIPKTQYSYPKSDRINPFNKINGFNSNIYEGVSSLLFSELSYYNDINILYQDTKPTLIKKDNKNYFYCFDLKHIEGDKEYFDSLSSLLEYYYVTLKKESTLNSEQSYLINYINKEIKKLNDKITKQKYELVVANDNLNLEKIGNLLASNLYLVKKGDNKIIVKDFYSNYEDFEIKLDPLLSPKKNLESIFNKYNKAKRAITYLNEQIEIANNDILYYECLLNQASIAKSTDVNEILKELDIKKDVTKKQVKKVKPNYLTYYYNDDIIYVGKNNIQNNYVTNTLANKNDYFFHVQGNPGSHVILKTSQLNEDNITLAATIASYYSTSRDNTNVCVDYTMVKNLKKVPKMKGSFVTYPSHKSVFVKPNIDYIKSKTSK